ncbi:MAG: 4Fe-4S binding protein [Treponema sp.]|nr:4Fe-4S binding protein [Treponema sp.]
MIRKLIHIDEEKCDGCGICATACHEGAIDIINGKAKLVRENFCDGFGDCLPSCPTGAITFEEREAPAYDEEAVRAAQYTKNKARKHMNELNHAEHDSRHEHHMAHHGMHGGCPGARAMAFERRAHDANSENALHNANDSAPHYPSMHENASPDMHRLSFKPVSRLAQWPVQIKLLPTQAPFYDGAKLLIAADCAAYAYANFHEDFIKGKVTLIGCPKLDDIDYTEKLTEIIRSNNIIGMTIVRMEVPCCGGIQMAAQQALQASGKFIPWQVVTISRDGEILD